MPLTCLLYTSVFDNLKADEPKSNFTIGIVDDVTNLSLPLGETVNCAPEGTTRCKFWGFGSDGTCLLYTSRCV